MRSSLSKNKNQIEDNQALAGSTEPSSGSHFIESKCGLFSPSKCHSLVSNSRPVFDGGN
jgi:hypothetical protein